VTPEATARGHEERARSKRVTKTESTTAKLGA
jgi:hypothetical protein